MTGRTILSGIAISVAVHAALLAVPFPFTVRIEQQEIALYVLEGRRSAATKEPAAPQKTAVTVKKPQKRHDRQHPRKKRVEPSRRPVAIVKKPGPPAARLPQPGAARAVADTPDEMPAGPLDTSFGASNGPAFAHRATPAYPFVARRRGQEGRVLLRLTIDSDGTLLDVEVMEATAPSFAKAAVGAVKRSTFLPATRNGTRVSSRALLPVSFTLRRK